MARPLFLLGVFMGLLCTLFRLGSTVSLDDLFVVQPGSVNGGCDDYFDQMSKDGMLDTWHQDILDSLDSALGALQDNVWPSNPSVKDALSAFFSMELHTEDAVEPIRTQLGYIYSFFSLEVDPNTGEPYYDSADRYLFCNSTYLEYQAPDTPALNTSGGEVLKNGQTVNIQDVPKYRAALNSRNNNKPWWAGRHTPLNGYYIDDQGADYCNENAKDDEPRNLGLTSTIQFLSPDGKYLTKKDVESVVLCPYGLTNPNQPATYEAGAQIIAANRANGKSTNLTDVVPRSATLLHEVFHVINGAGFLQAGKEFYDIAACIRATAGKSKKNPENYVFFVAHMHYLFGSADDGIDRNWDFGEVDDETIWGALP